MVDREKLQAVQSAIAGALFDSTPETWSKIVLTLRRSGEGLGEFRHSITNPEGLPPVLPDDSLFEATYRLDELLREEAVLAGAEIRLEYDEQTEDWSFEVDYSFEP